MKAVCLRGHVTEARHGGTRCARCGQWLMPMTAFTKKEKKDEQ